MTDSTGRVAAMTYVYNEADNLPVWCDYYGELFGYQNLFVIDRMSDDGSTKMTVGHHRYPVNVIRVPRRPFDDDDKAVQMTALHTMLLRSYDVVVTGDCDELLVPDPARYAGLNDYIHRLFYAADDKPFVTGMGMNLIHVLTHELPLDVSKPLLGQRRYWGFTSSLCKTLISRVPLEWCAGLHAHRLPPLFDTELFVLHIKLRDYVIAMKRQTINEATVWSDRSVAQDHGVHHRYGFERFVSDTFLSAIDAVKTGIVIDLALDALVADLRARTVQAESGFWHPPVGLHCMFRVPERFFGLV